MSALDGFRSIWTNANAAFGQGTPSGGAQFDQSGSLHQLQHTVNSAQPDTKWIGAASDSYSETNSRQARTIGGIADLDKRLAVEVDRAAGVVTAGRADLDSVLRSVNDAAARVPNTAAGERMLYPTISKGAKEIQDILNRSHGDLTAIGERIRGIGSDYQLLGGGDDGTGGTTHDKPPKTPNTTLDLDDIIRMPPFVSGDATTFPPSHTIEIGPGTYVPANDFPGVTPPPPTAPLDYKDIKYLGPFNPAKPSGQIPPGYMELVPGSGAWVPNPDAPGFVSHTPEVPVDMATARILEPGESIPADMIELYPGSRVYIPNPVPGAPR